MPSNYPDGVDGTHPYFNEPNPPECPECGAELDERGMCRDCEDVPFDYGEDAPVAEVIDHDAEAEAIKRLAVAQAIYKSIAADVKTGDPDNLRGAVDAIMAERFGQARKLGLAPKSFDYEVDGQKVGTYSITTTKAKPAETRMELRVGSRAALLEWALPLGYFDVDMKAVREHMERTGEVPGGCELVPVEVPAVEGGGIAKTSLRIDPAKVAGAMGGGELSDMIVALLEGGE